MRFSSPLFLARFGVVAGLATALFPAALAAQEVVQQLPNPAAEKLASAMQRLSSNPVSVSALVEAGRASLDLNDNDAALGFFTRAQRIEPENGRVLAGLALVALRRGDAITALQLFDNANIAGEPMTPFAADRALAYDLVGNNARAQRLYRQVLTGPRTAEVTRRLALSYAISGDQAASEEVLLPLLERQDRAAYRSRAFALAILGHDEEAVQIAQTMLPPRVAGRMAPYLRHMKRLTRAQQAAAANLGRFPAASQIGREDPRLAAIGIAPPQPRNVENVDERLIPRGEPLAQSDPPVQAAPEPVAVAVLDRQAAGRSEVGPEAIASEPVAAPERQAASLPVALAPSGELPALAQADTMPAQQPPPLSRPAPQAASALRPEPVAVAEPTRVAEPVNLAVISQPVEQALPEGQAAAIARPGFTLVESGQSDPASGGFGDLPQSDQLAQVIGSDIPDEPVDMASAFAEFAQAENVPPVPVADAVDITAIEIPRERPEPAPVEQEPAPPQHPSRHWVQVATGRDIAAFRFDWRRLGRNANGLLDDREAFYTPWGQTNRLLTGPFDSARSAQQFVTDLGEEGIDSFRVVSDNGQEIKPL